MTNARPRSFFQGRHIGDLIAASRVSRFGYVGGVGAADASAPRHNLTGDPYHTDGQRAVVVLSGTATHPELFGWD